MMPSQLQKFQSLKPESTATDTIISLIVEDPQHPPLYFLMARFWMERLGNSVTVCRTLPALISLLSLPLMYLLALELFGQEAKLTASLATALLALSSVDITYAQMARQYSLLTVCIIGSSWLFLRAYRLPTWQNWLYYSFVCSAGLYTHPFFAFTIAGHLSFSIGYWLLKFNQAEKLLFKYFSSLSISFLLYSPWIWVLITNRQTAFNSNSWSAKNIGFLTLVNKWLANFTSIFLSVDYTWASIFDGIRLLFLVLIGIAIYTVCLKASRLIGLFILTSIFVPFMLLALPDLVFGGMRSTITRYLASCYPAIQLAVAYFLANQIHNRKKFWQIVLVLIFTSIILFSTHMVFSDGNSKIPKIANIVNSTLFPRLIGDSNYGRAVGDLLALSYLLDERVQILLWDEKPDVFKPNQLTQILSNNTDAGVFFFQPSEQLRLVLAQKKGELKSVPPKGELWLWSPRSN